MKTARLTIGILTIIFSFIIMFQSCAAGLVESIDASNGVQSGTSGSAGIILALFFIIGGIIGIVCRKIKSGSIVAGCFYAIGGLIAIFNIGVFEDLLFWSILAFIFAAVFILGAIFEKKNKNPKSTSNV